MAKKQKEQEKKQTMNVVLGLALLFLSVVLAVNAVQKVQAAAVVGAVMGFCGVALFGGVGICLLVGEVRQLMQKRK